MRILLPVLFSVAAFAQTLEPGRILVATDKSRDRDFAGSIILLVHCDRQSAVGLMLNRPLKVPLSEVFPKEARGRSETVYAGGPVTIGYMALVRAPVGKRLADDVHVLMGKQAIAEALPAHTSPARIRVYLGNCGWTAQQLRDEVSRGLWRVTTAAGYLFRD